MKKILVALIGTTVLLAACSSNNAEDEALTVSTVTLPDTYDEARAQAAYKKSCASCHGADLQGAPAYNFPITGISKEEVYIATIKGVGRMPGKLVSGEEAENLSVWIAAQ